MLRRIAHPLLATAFVADGLITLSNPDNRVKAATTLVQRGENSLPRGIAAKLPGDPTQMVRVNAAVQVGGGVLLAWGKAPRLASLLLAATVVPAALTEQDFWAESDPERRASKRTAFVKDISLLGGLLIASADTAGKPSIGWRARRAAKRLSKSGNNTFGDSMSTLAGTAVQLADSAAQRIPAVTEPLRARGEQLAETARDRVPQLAETARDRGQHLAETARDRAGELVESAKAAGERLNDTAREQRASWGEATRDRTAASADAARDHAGRWVAETRRRGMYLADAGTHLADAAKDATERVRSR